MVLPGPNSAYPAVAARSGSTTGPSVAARAGLCKVAPWRWGEPNAAAPFGQVTKWPSRHRATVLDALGRVVDLEKGADIVLSGYRIGFRVRDGTSPSRSRSSPNAGPSLEAVCADGGPNGGSLLPDRASVPAVLTRACCVGGVNVAARAAASGPSAAAGKGEGGRSRGERESARSPRAKAASATQRSAAKLGAGPPPRPPAQKQTGCGVGLLDRRDLRVPRCRAWLGKIVRHSGPHSARRQGFVRAPRNYGVPAFDGFLVAEDNNAPPMIWARPIGDERLAADAVGRSSWRAHDSWSSTCAGARRPQLTWPSKSSRLCGHRSFDPAGHRSARRPARGQHVHQVECPSGIR